MSGLVGELLMMSDPLDHGIWTHRQSFCLCSRGLWPCRKGSSEEGPGAVLLVVEGSSHDTCIDVRAIFGAKYGWAIKPLMGRHTRVRPAGICLQSLM